MKNPIELTYEETDLLIRLLQKEITELMRKQHYEFESEIRRLREDVTNRVGVLERWKYLIIGGSIVVGFVINAYMRYVM